MRIIVAISLAVMALLIIFIGLAGPAVAADQCAAPGGTGGCFATIQAAIDAATDGDTVNVVAGTYAENIVITKNLTLLGGFDDTSLTSRTPRSSLIDGSGAGVVISITNSVEVTIEGFTISGGNATTSGGDGGGIFVDTATVTIVDNLIENNIASSDSAVGGDGGGIYATRSTVVITGNTIQLNRAYSVTTGSAWGAGGGIGLGSANNAATIVNNEILSNTAAALASLSTSAEGYGGAISCSGEQLVVEGNIIRNNLALSSGSFASGGAINVFGTQAVTMTDNTILQNTAVLTSTGDAIGGGVSAGGINAVPRMIVLSNNQIMSNTTAISASGSGYVSGGGVNLFGAGASGEAVLLENNQIIGNVTIQEASTVGNAAGAASISDLESVQIISNEIRSNAGSDAGSVTVSDAQVILSRNRFEENQSDSEDGTVVVVWEGILTSTNNIFADNAVGGLRAGHSEPVLIKVVNDTYYNNSGYGIKAGGENTTIYVTNTIIDGHEYGLTAYWDAKIYSSYNLFNNTDNYEDTAPGTNDITDQDPKFVDAGNNDFHLASDSPAVDRGTSVGAPTVDFEGDTRPRGGGIDIGADESPFQSRWPVYLPLVIK